MIFIKLVELLGSLQLGDRIPAHHQSLQIDEHYCIKSILNVIFLHVCLPSQLHEKTGEEHLTAILDMKLMI